MPPQQPSTKEVLNIVSGVVLPLTRVERTMIIPPDESRHENVAEHSYMLGVVACALAERLDNNLNLGLVAQYALIHDTVEVYAGDTTVWALQDDLESKPAREQASLLRITEEQKAFPWLTKTIEEYEKLESQEAKFVYALDKILAHMLVIIGDIHPVHPSWAAYLKTEEVAREKIKAYPALLPYFDDLCQIFRDSPHFFKQT